MLAMTAVAVVVGAASVMGVWEWVADLPQWVLRVFGARACPRRPGWYLAPSEATLCRALALVDGAELDTAISVWITDNGPICQRPICQRSICLHVPGTRGWAGQPRAGMDGVRAGRQDSAGAPCPGDGGAPGCICWPRSPTRRELLQDNDSCRSVKARSRSSSPCSTASTLT
ncbi:transposase family protein, partial [Actinophytocola sp.]|uniref:transposase family protein n=1 Tax=Actinophytocola sp. TaxID=1872138 RepID=UPI003D6B9E6F